MVSSASYKHFTVYPRQLNIPGKQTHKTALLFMRASKLCDLCVLVNMR